MRRAQVSEDFDGAWKYMVSERRFADFMAFFMPDLYEAIDRARGVVFLEQELRAITRKSPKGKRVVDRLAQVYLKDATEKWVLIHVELQAQDDPGLPLRMCQYRYRALDLFGERPIACLAILGDPNPSWKPDNYRNSYYGTELAFRFRVVKLLEYSGRISELEISANPFARFVVAHLKTLETQGDFETRLQWKLRLVQGLYDMNVSEDEIGQLYHDFDWLLTLPDSLENVYHSRMSKFEEERTMPHLSTAERIGRAEGRKEARAEAIEELRDLLTGIGTKRLGEPGHEVREQIAAMKSRAKLHALCLRIMDVESWDELLA